MYVRQEAVIPLISMRYQRVDDQYTTIRRLPIKMSNNYHHNHHQYIANRLFAWAVVAPQRNVGGRCMDEAIANGARFAMVDKQTNSRDPISRPTSVC
jgi:hypothetical protein